MVTKVQLICTSKGWVWQVFEGRKIVAQKEMRLTSTGAVGTKANPLGNIDEDLVEAIDDGDPYDIAALLERIAE